MVDFIQDWWELTFAVIGAIGAYFYLCLGKQHDFDQLVGEIESGGNVRQAYLARLETGFDRLDRWFGEVPRSTAAFNPTAWFTGHGFGTHLTIAFVYPYIAVLILWFMTGINTSGVAGLLPSEMTLPWRAVVLLFITVEVSACIYGIKTSGWRSWLALPVVVAVASVGFGVGFGAVDVVVAGVVVGVVAGVGFGAVDVAVVGVVAVSVTGAVVVAVAVVGAGVGVGAVVGAILFFENRARQFGKLSLYYCLFAPIILLLIWWLSKYFVATGQGQVGAALSIFFVVLPLINAIFDWFSVGITRGLLLWARARNYSVPAMVFTGLSDLCAAFFCLIGLALAMTTFLTLLNERAISGGNSQLINLRELFDGLRNDPWNVSRMWVHLTLLSTFLPTLAHLAVIIGAWAMQLPLLRRPLQNRMTSGFAFVSEQSHRARFETAALWTIHRSIAWAGAIILAVVFFWALGKIVPGYTMMLLDFCDVLHNSI